MLDKQNKVTKIQLGKMFQKSGNTALFRQNALKFDVLRTNLGIYSVF